VSVCVCVREREGGGYFIQMGPSPLVRAVRFSPPSMNLGVGVGLRVWGLGFGVQGLGVRILGLGFWGLGFFLFLFVLCLGFRVQGLGLGFQGLNPRELHTTNADLAAN